MDTLLPSRAEAAQLHRLRQLRLDQARKRCQQAEAEWAAAQEALRVRDATIADLRARLACLAEAGVGSGFADMPRWGELTRAHRDLLLDRLEREDYARADDEQACDAAAERLAQERRALARARGREDAMRGVLHQTQRAHAGWLEQRAERELDGAPGAPRGVQR